jgi:hypothetical protein
VLLVINVTPEEARNEFYILRPCGETASSKGDIEQRSLEHYVPLN